MSARASSRGFSLIELLVALAVFGVVTASALALFDSQEEAFRDGTERMSVLQNLRFAANALEKDLRTSGSHLAPAQPIMIYAGPRTVAFNADFATNDANDPFAVYYEPEATAAEVMAMTFAQRANLPGTSFPYPDTTYGEGGTLSPAETLVFYFAPDSTTGRNDDFVLWRKVNGRSPEVIARRLLPPDTAEFLQYWELPRNDTALSELQRVPSADLPLTHTVTVHASSADTGAAARVDRVHGVRIRLTATNGKTGSEERRASLDRLVKLPNAGVSRRPSCGDAPLFGSTFTATPAVSGGDPVVQLAWGQATDESGGEQDVVRYVLYRRPAGSSGWGDPMLSIPSGQPSYSYTDSNVVAGDSYDYGLAVQDCTPSLSTITSATGITAPTP